MIPATFEYIKATSTSHALDLLAEHGDEAKLLAGGHSLIPIMKLRMNNPEVVIDISKALSNDFSFHDKYILIGAGATHGEIESDKIINNYLPMMADAASMIGDPQVRNKGTIGGSLAHSDPAADWPGVVLALGGSIHIKSKSGNRKTNADNFFKGMFYTDLGASEIIENVEIPTPKSSTKMAYCKFPQPASRYAIVGCAVCLEMEGDTCTNARVAMNGVAGYAYREKGVEESLQGQKLTAEIVANAASKAGEGIEAMSDHFASSEYRIHLAKVFVRRAIEKALA